MSSTLKVTALLVAFLHICSGFCPAGDEGPPDLSEEELDKFQEESGSISYEYGDNSAIVEDDEDENAFDGNRHLQQFAKAVTSTNMDKLYKLDGKKTSARLMLDYMISETSITPEFLTELFMHKADVDTEEGLKKKLFDEKSSLTYLTKILQHLQKNPIPAETNIDDPSQAETKEQHHEDDQPKDEL